MRTAFVARSMIQRKVSALGNKIMGAWTMVMLDKLDTHGMINKSSSYILNREDSIKLCGINYATYTAWRKKKPLCQTYILTIIQFRTKILLKEKRYSL